MDIFNQKLNVKDVRLGDRVIITSNPHDYTASKILGTISAIGIEAGFGGCDLVDVSYEHPITGDAHELPFSPKNLLRADAQTLTLLAQRYEAIAAQFRRYIEK